MKREKSDYLTLLLQKFVVFSLVVFFDFCTKHWVVNHLPLIQYKAGFPFGGIGLFQSPFFSLSIVHTTNTGAAWSLFADSQFSLLVLRVMITLGLIVYLIFNTRPCHVQIPLTFVAAGAVGNILDFFLYGHVIDMIYCLFGSYSFPVFNVADSAIFCAVAYLVIRSFWGKRHRAA